MDTANGIYLLDLNCWYKQLAFTWTLSLVKLLAMLFVFMCEVWVWISGMETNHQQNFLVQLHCLYQRLLVPATSIPNTWKIEALSIVCHDFVCMWCGFISEVLVAPKCQPVSLFT